MKVIYKYAENCHTYIVIQVAIYSMHRNPKYWKDPEAFVPERFIGGSPEAAMVIDPHAWKAFGDGQRGCIGQKFAMEEAKITLVTLYQRFIFELEAGQVWL